jgi:hypothetical protein
MEAHVKAFGVLWSANALSNLADGLAFVSMPLLAASLAGRVLGGFAAGGREAENLVEPGRREWFAARHAP